MSLVNKGKAAYPVRLERMNNDELKIVWEASSPSEGTIYYSGNPAFNESAVVELSAARGGAEWTIRNPEPGSRGYLFIRLPDGTVITAAERVLPLQGAINFRDMGGYMTADGRSVKWGKLYRSADLSGLTDEDLDYLRSIELAWICDLRSDVEVEQHPSPPIGNAVNEQLSFFAEANPEKLMALHEITVDLLADMNRGLVNNTALTADFIRRLISKNGAPILFHCMAGKDRTGFVASIILQALGVAREQIKDDYLMTNLFAEQFKAKMAQKKDILASLMDKLPPDIINALMLVRLEYIAASFEEIDRQYGSFESYWQRGLGLGMEELEQLRDMYLE